VEQIAVIRATSAVDAAAAPAYAWTGPSQDYVLFAAEPVAAAAAAAAAAASVTAAARHAKIVQQMLLQQQHSVDRGASVVEVSHSCGSSTSSSSSSSSGNSTHTETVSSVHLRSTVHYAHNSSCGPRHATVTHNAVFFNGTLRPV
jgi:type IV secretory pathway TrbL component